MHSLKTLLFYERSEMDAEPCWLKYLSAQIDVVAPIG